jgi:hypothetical protein
MSASDENLSGDKEKAGNDTVVGSGRKIEHESPVVSHPSPLKRKLKLYGVLLLILVVGAAIGAGAYPYWRSDARVVVARVGLDLEQLEKRLQIPAWFLTHGRDTPEVVVAAKAVVTTPAETVANVPPLAVEPSQPKETPVTEAVSTTQAAVASSETGEVMEALAGRLSTVEAMMSRFEERLVALESAKPSEIVSSGASPSQAPAVPPIPLEVVEQLDTIATRLATLEEGRESPGVEKVAAAPTSDSGALIATVVALAERVASMEARGSTSNTEFATLRDDTLALAARMARLDDDVKQVGATIKEDTPARDRAALVLLSIGQLAVATSGSGPYEAQLNALRAVAGDLNDTGDALEQLNTHATIGAPTFPALRSAFSEASSAVIRSRDIGSPDGILGQTLSRIASLVTIRKVDDIGAETVDGLLAAGDAALVAGDLATAVAAVSKLDGAPGEAISDWLGAARARLAVDGALSELQAAAVSALAAAG